MRMAAHSRRVQKLLQVGGVLAVALLSCSWAAPVCSEPIQPTPAAQGEQIIGCRPGTWRSASVFTHAAWGDLLFYGGSAGADGGDPRHEMEIGVYHLAGARAGKHHPDNPIISRAQFGLDKPGRGITPLSVYEADERLFMFCTARPEDDRYPRIVVINALTAAPLKWNGLTTVIDKSLSGETHNHGVSVLDDPDDPTRLLLYFAARTPPREYRILLASVPVARIMDPAAYRLLKTFRDPVLMREQAKANYPFVEYHADRGEYVLWYSGHSLDDPATRSSFRSVSKVKDQFEPAATPAIVPSGVNGRNDRAYATGPKRHRGKLYYSGRAEARGVYRGIFVLPDR